MYTDGDGSTILELANDVQSLLIAARILRQEAVIQSEFDDYYQEVGGTFEKTQNLRSRARQLRMAAQIAMKQIEVINGQVYLRDYPPFPLKMLINGKNFRGWIAHNRQYQDHSLFRGVDPN